MVVLISLGLKKLGVPTTPTLLPTLPPVPTSNGGLLMGATIGIVVAAAVCGCFITIPISLLDVYCVSVIRLIYHVLYY